ncbi:MAG: transposase [Candidatus Syntropharchaeia archaeon]
MRANAFGFYAINGESVIDFKENSKKESVCEFLGKIREKMTLVYMPPYSPDLNPIEQIWRAIKRVLSPLLIKTLDKLKEVISSSFYGLTQRISFAEKWIKKFLNFG